MAIGKFEIKIIAFKSIYKFLEHTDCSGPHDEDIVYVPVPSKNVAQVHFVIGKKVSILST